MMKFKGKSPSELKTLEQVENLPEYAGILSDETILIDIDDMEQSEILMKIVEDLQLNCLVYQTSRGRHFLFKNDGVDQCYTHIKSAIGLTMDVKVGHKNSYEVLKFNGEERFVEWDIEEGSDYATLPKWLIPVKTNTDFYNMEEGDGRNSALFGYELTLQGAGLTPDECKDAITIMNQYVLKNPLPKNELETVLRDEAFAKPVFYQGRTFLHDRFATYIKDQYHIVRMEGQLFVYMDGQYHSDPMKLEKAMIQVIPNLKDSQRKEVLKYLQIIADDGKPAPLNLIAFRNGVLNIDTDEFKGNSPEYIITNRIPWDYNPNAESEVVEKFLNSVSCNDASIRSLLEECIGYCFYRNSKMGASFILTGMKENGKSTYLETLNKILGEDNTSALDLKNLGDRFSKASLYKKLANIGDDISDEFIPDPSLFKKITTGERIDAEYKGTNKFEFNPYATLIFSANEIPRINDKTGAVLRRLLIIPFNANFSKDNPERDPDLRMKLAQQDNIEYLIKLGIQGLKRVLKNKHFTSSAKAQTELDDYEILNNPIKGFFQEQDEDYLFRYDTNTIYLAYDSYCVSNGFKSEGKTMFGRTVATMFSVVSKPRKIDGKSVRMYFKTTDE